MPARRTAHFLQGKPDTLHIMKLQISLIQHWGTSVCDAIQQHFLLLCVIRGGITKPHFKTRQNPAKSLLYHFTEMVQATPLSGA